MNANQIVTIADLERFKRELFAEFRLLLKDGKGQPAKKWLKTREVIKLLDISQGKLQTMRNSRTIQFTRIGGTLYYDQEDINRMMETNEKTAKRK